MRYYPTFLRVADRACLVIGGGRIAAQKVHSLIRAGARVTVLSPDIVAEIAEYIRTGVVAHRARPYARGDVRGFFLAIAATNDVQVQQLIRADADVHSTLLNVVDVPDLCDFVMPAVIARDDLTIAVSTAGASPAMARRIRDELEGSFGPEYGVALRLLRRLRHVLRDAHAARRREIFSSLVDSPLLDYLREQRAADVDRLLAATVGGGVSLASLGIEVRHP